MPIPDYQTVMLPLLKLIAKRGELNRSDAVQLISDELGLTEDERRELLPSGRASVIRSRVGWARTYLKKAGLIDYPKRGIAVVSERGKKVLSENPLKIDLAFLEQFPEFIEFKKASLQKDNNDQPVDSQSPEEMLESAYTQMKNELLDELLDKIKSSTPRFFEELVVTTIVKMGYGGSLRDAGKAIGKSGDEGIDGIINEDRLGLDVIYLQAKKWEAKIGRPDIQKFAGALLGKRAKKGIFITTSDYSSEAREYAKHLDAKIILINGQQFAELMWEHDIGLSSSASYEIKKIDNDYFGE